MGPLEVVLLSPASVLGRGPEGIVELVDVLEAHAGPLAPDRVFHPAGSVPRTREAVLARIADARPDHVLLQLLRSAAPELAMSFSLGRDGRIPFVFRLDVPLAWIAGDPEVRSGAVVTLVRALASGRPGLGWAHPKGAGRVPPREAPYSLVDAHWLDVLGADVVARLGRDRVASAPAHARDELPGGGVVLRTSATPLALFTDEAKRARAQLFAHLTGAEVTITAPPVVHRRRAAPKPDRPAPAEQCAASQQAPSDVADPAGAIARYQGLYAEQLIALLHPAVPEIVRAEPSSLAAIDQHLLRSDYLAAFGRERVETELVPAAGAYLGALLVRELGGRWVPRVQLDETAVIVGERAWLPFLRARRALTTPDGVLQYSLAQLYQAAAAAAATEPRPA